MGMLKRWSAGCLWATLCVVFFWPAPVNAKDYNIIPTLILDQEYNNNILYTRTKELSDYISYVTPMLVLNHKTERLDVSTSFAADFLFYWQYSELNTINQRYSLDGEYKLTERWMLRGLGSYVKDTTLDSQLEETGAVAIRQNRERFKAGGGFGYKMTERSIMDFNYLYVDTRYQKEFGVDTRFNSGELAYRRRLKNERDIISVIPRFTYGDSDRWDIYNYTLNLEWKRRFSEIYDLSFMVGGRYTQQNFKYEKDDSNTLGGVANIKLTRRGEVTDTFIAFSQGLRPNSNREIRNVSRFWFNVNHLLRERFGVGLGGSLYYSSLEENDPLRDDDRWYFSITPSMFYLLTRNFRLSLFYSYAREDRLDLETNPVKDRQRAWVSLDLDFPRKW